MEASSQLPGSHATTPQTGCGLSGPHSRPLRQAPRSVLAGSCDCVTLFTAACLMHSSEAQKERVCGECKGGLLGGVPSLSSSLVGAPKSCTDCDWCGCAGVCGSALGFAASVSVHANGHTPQLCVCVCVRVRVVYTPARLALRRPVLPSLQLRVAAQLPPASLPLPLRHPGGQLPLAAPAATLFSVSLPLSLDVSFLSRQGFLLSSGTCRAGGKHQNDRSRSRPRRRGEPRRGRRLEAVLPLGAPRLPAVMAPPWSGGGTPAASSPRPGPGCGAPALLASVMPSRAAAGAVGRRTAHGGDRRGWP